MKPTLRTNPNDIILRQPRPGDWGWIVHRHGALYAEEYGYNDHFEGVVARVVAEFIASHDPARERCWVADHGGRVLGSIMLAAKSPRVAKLRLLYVEPSTRGMGLGARLIAECVQFARAAGYRKVTLWTHKNLRAARKLYRRAGFQLVQQVPNPSFGRKLVDETWELDLE